MTGWMGCGWMSGGAGAGGGDETDSARGEEEELDAAGGHPGRESEEREGRRVEERGGGGEAACESIDTRRPHVEGDGPSESVLLSGSIVQVIGRPAGCRGCGDSAVVLKLGNAPERKQQSDPERQRREPSGSRVERSSPR